MSMGAEDHACTDGFGKTHIPLRRGTAVHSEGEAPQGDVEGVNEELAEEPHQHPPPSLRLGHPLRRGIFLRFVHICLFCQSALATVFDGKHNYLAVVEEAFDT